jgi:RES domain-containing protein
MLPVCEIDQRDTHRLIPARFADEGASVLTRLTDDEDLLDGIFQLDNATNDRLIAESGNAPGIDVRELVFGIPQYRIINASFCHPAPGGSRFNSEDRGAWYAGFEVETSQAEVAFHMQISLRETAWEQEEVTDYVDYLADFRAEFHDLRSTKDHREALAPDSYRASQALAAELLELGSAGIVYPCVRREGGTCLVCFRPVLVINARKGWTYEFVFRGWEARPQVRRRA